MRGLGEVSDFLYYSRAMILRDRECSIDSLAQGFASGQDSDPLDRIQECVRSSYERTIEIYLRYSFEPFKERIVLWQPLRVWHSRTDPWERVLSLSLARNKNASSPQQLQVPTRASFLRVHAKATRLHCKGERAIRLDTESPMPVSTEW